MRMIKICFVVINITISRNFNKILLTRYSSKVDAFPPGIAEAACVYLKKNPVLEIREKSSNYLLSYFDGI